MALVQVRGAAGTAASGAGTVYSSPVMICEVRATWDADWEIVPYLTPLNFMQCAAPSIGTANLEYRWGTIKREDKNSFSNYPFIDLRGRFVRIRPAGRERAAVWVGVIDVDQPFPFGIEHPGGVLRLIAFELGHLLDRVIIEDVPALSGQDKVILVQNVPTANERYERGAAQLGNRSEEKYKLAEGATSAEEVYVFGGNYKWTNLNLIRLMLLRFTPSGVTFRLGGQVDALSLMENVTPLQGRSVWQILGDMIPRHYGLIWTVRPTDDVVTVEVDSVLEQDLKVGEYTIEKNAKPVDLDLRTSIIISDLQIVRQRQNLYHEIEVRGARLLSCFSLSYANGGLEEAWPFGVDSLEAEYLEAAKNSEGYGGIDVTEKQERNDLFRESDKFTDVWTKFRIPRSWDGLAGIGNEKKPVLLKCNENGEVEWAKAAEGLTDGKAADDDSGDVAFAPHGKHFEPSIPLEVAMDYTSDPPGDQQPDNAEPVYRKPFLLQVSGGKSTMGLCDRPTEAYKEASAHVFVHDREMAIALSVSPRHLYAGSKFDFDVADRSGVVAEPSFYDPLVDFTQLAATVAMRMDGFLRAVARSKDAPEENARRKVVYLQDAEYWAVCGGTIVDIGADGALQLAPGKGIVLRDDSDRCRAAAAFGLAWYGRERASIAVTLKYLDAPCMVGQLVKSALSTDGNISVGTPVTSIGFDCVGRSVTVRTDWHEMDVSRF